jgi:predicted TIM-barrel fold metal-dependent hydrolase
VLDRGARIVALRLGPVFTRDGWKSPADPAFDPFWDRVDEARLVVAVHPGFDDGTEQWRTPSHGHGAMKAAGAGGRCLRSTSTSLSSATPRRRCRAHPVEQVLFGSDWPHAEGLAEPKNYFAYITELSVNQQRKIMRDNARSLTFPA